MDLILSDIMNGNVQNITENFEKLEKAAYSAVKTIEIGRAHV